MSESGTTQKMTPLFVTFIPIHTDQKVRRCQTVVANINQNVEECHTKKQIYLYGTIKPPWPLLDHYTSTQETQNKSCYKAVDIVS